MMVIYKGEGLKMFFEPVSKCSCRFTNVLFITLNPGTFVSAEHPTLMCGGISIFWDYQEVLDGSSSLEMYLYPMLVTDVLDTH